MAFHAKYFARKFLPPSSKLSNFFLTSARYPKDCATALPKAAKSKSRKIVLTFRRRNDERDHRDPKESHEEHGSGELHLSESLLDVFWKQNCRKGPLSETQKLKKWLAGPDLYKVVCGMGGCMLRHQPSSDRLVGWDMRSRGVTSIME